MTPHRRPNTARLIAAAFIALSGCGRPGTPATLPPQVLAGVEPPVTLLSEPVTLPADDASAAAPPSAVSGTSADGAPLAPAAWRQATRLEIEAIGLTTDVVRAPIVRSGADSTWAVPAHQVGHGDLSGSVGEPGNAVLLGHLTSVNEGHVFRDLGRVPVGSVVAVDAGGRRYLYRVAESRLVPRDDISPLASTQAPTLTLVTCAGSWLASLQDFSHRLVLRAELIAEG